MELTDRALLARRFAHSIGGRGHFMAGDAETLRLIVIDLAGEIAPMYSAPANARDHVETAERVREYAETIRLRGYTITGDDVRQLVDCLEAMADDMQQLLAERGNHGAAG